MRVPGGASVPCDVRVLAKRRGPHHEHDVVLRERVPKARAVGGEVTRELRVRSGESSLPAERLLPHGRAERLGKLDERGPALRVVRAGSRDDRRTLRVREHRDQGFDRGGIGRCGTDDHARRGLVRALVRSCQPVVHRRDDERRAAGGRGLVPRAADGAGEVLRADGLVYPDGVVAGEPLEAPRQERLVREMAAVLLTHEDDQRRPIDARRRERAHGVPEAGRRVEERERGLGPAECVPGCHPDHGALVEPEHEVEIVREGGEEWHFRRARVREHLREVPLAKNVEDGVTDGGAGHVSTLTQMI